MQNRYTGDIGDYVKLALLRALASGRKLGVAWYLYPDESHNDDGKHIAYLRDPNCWRGLDPDLFDTLVDVVRGERSVARLEASAILAADYFDAPLQTGNYPPSLRSEARNQWFSDLQSALSGCDLVFADPDNGLTDDQPTRLKTSDFGKRLPLSEAKALADVRSAIIYHHNTRFRGGHDLEVEHWLSELGNAIAIRANAFSCRTFFLINPDDELRGRAEAFCARWKDYRVSLQSPGSVN